MSEPKDRRSDVEPAHGLTHRQFTDGRLTPACICGWYSPTGSHNAFERHLREAFDV